MRLESVVQNWINARNERRWMKRYGGIQRCPWCRQWAQAGEAWMFEPWPRDTMLDRLTCGVCTGTSLWKWEVIFIFLGALDPPIPAPPTWDVYDIPNARLKLLEDRP